MDGPQRVLLRRPKLPSKPVLPKIASTPGEVTLDIQSAFDDGTSFTLTDTQPDADFSTPGISDVKANGGYRENTFDGASPPPPSELSAALHNEVYSTSFMSTENFSRGRPPMKRSYVMTEQPFLMDPAHRQPTNLGTYVEGKSLLRPIKRRGPAPLPARAPLQANVRPMYVDITDEWEPRYFQVSEFTLNDFLVHVAEVEKFDYNLMSKVVFSKHNYKRIQQMLFENYIRPKQKTFNSMEFSPPEDMHGYPATRVPQKQIIIEMAAMIKAQMSELMNIPMIPVIRPLPKYNFSDEPKPHTEIVLYEAGSRHNESRQPVKRFHPADVPNLKMIDKTEKSFAKESSHHSHIQLRGSKTEPPRSLASKEPSKVTRKTTKSYMDTSKSPEFVHREYSKDMSDYKENSSQFPGDEKTFERTGEFHDHGSGEAKDLRKESTKGSSKKPTSHSLLSRGSRSAGKVQGDSLSMEQGQEVSRPSSHHIIQTSSPTYFQGSRRSNSPFQALGADTISPAELAVLDSIMAGGLALSIKAHFVSELPSIGQLSSTLVYLNLSFNNFTKMPQEVFEITNLETLKMRDNPLQRLPETIGRLEKLTTIVLSFCLLTNLPDNLFLLPNLQHLDVAYNKLQALPNQIGQLSELQELNLEGNQLKGLPANAMKLKSLKYLRVRNNFMHPVFWKESIINSPPKLGDLAATVFVRNNLESNYHGFPPHVTNRLQQKKSCECCRQSYYGNGLQFLRPVNKLFGIKQLPLLFSACTPQCLSDSRTDNTLISMFM